MTYESLAKLFYKDSSPDRFGRNEEMARLRRESESSFKLGIKTKAGEELFFAVPREMSRLSESVLRNERHVSAAFSNIPGIARGSLVRSLIADEVVCTNDIEGIHSTRKQINELLEAEELSGVSLADKRFRELAKLYLGLTGSNTAERPRTPSDIRKIYDLVMKGEELGESAPDGLLFRKGEVQVIGNGGKVLHEGLCPESAIIDALTGMISLADSVDVPEIYSAIAAHYVFEYVHPFYDGNGRTGRYLLALYLSRPLSLLTSLSLSRTIAQHKANYYRAFKEVELPLNHGEITPFVICLLELISISQDQILGDVERRGSLLSSIEMKIAELQDAGGYSDSEADTLYVLVQNELFASDFAVPLERLAEEMGKSQRVVRSTLKKLEERGDVVLATKRPLRFQLSQQCRGELGIEEI